MAETLSSMKIPFHTSETLNNYLFQANATCLVSLLDWIKRNLFSKTIMGLKIQVTILIIAIRSSPRLIAIISIVTWILSPIIVFENKFLLIQSNKETRQVAFA